MLPKQPSGILISSRCRYDRHAIFVPGGGLRLRKWPHAGRIDKDRSGTLDRSELEGILKVLGVEVEGFVLDQIMSVLDVDGDGSGLFPRPASYMRVYSSAHAMQTPCDFHAWGGSWAESRIARSGHRGVLQPHERPQGGAFLSHARRPRELRGLAMQLPWDFFPQESAGADGRAAGHAGEGRCF